MEILFKALFELESRLEGENTYLITAKLFRQSGLGTCMQKGKYFIQMEMSIKETYTNQRKMDLANTCTKTETNIGGIGRKAGKMGEGNSGGRLGTATRGIGETTNTYMNTSIVQ